MLGESFGKAVLNCGCGGKCCPETLEDRADDFAVNFS
jgi:hypothetical protein